MGAKRREREAPEVGAMALRVIRALVRRAEAGDTEALEQLQMIEAVAQSATGEALTRMQAGSGPVSAPYSWAELGGALGMTRQSAHERSRKWRAAHPEVAAQIDAAAV